MADLISRQAVIAALRADIPNNYDVIVTLAEAAQLVNDIPSVDPDVELAALRAKIAVARDLLDRIDSTDGRDTSYLSSALVILESAQKEAT